MRRVQESVRNLEQVLTSQQIEAESEKSRIETREKVILRTRANRALTGDLFLLFLSRENLDFLLGFAFWEARATFVKQNIRCSSVQGPDICLIIYGRLSH